MNNRLSALISFFAFHLILSLTVGGYDSSISPDNGNEAPAYAPGEVIVKFRLQDKEVIDSFIAGTGAYSFERVFPNPNHPLSTIYKLKFSLDVNVMSIVRRCEKSAMVEYAQPNYLNYPCSKNLGTPTDPFYPDQWALKIIDADSAWEIEKGSRDIIVAVVDSGVDYNHEDLKTRIWINPGEIARNGIDDDGNGYVDDTIGWDFADSPGIPTKGDHLVRDNDPIDETGHGTHVAGIIAAIPNNSTGVAGITWNCKIMALRAGANFYEDDDVSSAIVYAVDNGARIINMSWGSETLSYIVKDATEYAYNRGCVLVGAVGNDNRPMVIYPAMHNHVIAVGATNRWDRKAFFSNYGAGIDIVAPGDRVFSTVPNNSYSDWSGTSMAAPVVCGVTALMLSKRPGLTNEEVAQILRTSADKVDEPLFAGVGRINARKALLASSPLIARITAPDSGTSADKRFVIRGSAGGFRFLSFQLEYSNHPDFDNWTPISISKNMPIIDDVLGIWDISTIDEGTFAVRLRVFGQEGVSSEDRIVLNVDHSPPRILSLQVLPRLNGDECKYVFALKTDDLTHLEIFYRTALEGEKHEFQKLSSTSLAKVHDVYLSDNIPEGSYEYFVKVKNSAGLETVDNNTGKNYYVEIKPLRFNLDSFLGVATGLPAIYPVTGTADFDGDGRMEIVGMERPRWQYERVKIYERNDSGTYNEVFSSDISYFPHDVGDTDGDGLLEILGSKNENTFLFESPSSGLYPSKKIWEVKGIWGGQIADTDLDGKKEIISQHFGTGAICIYENRGDGSYLRTARLPNPTEGDNYLSARFAIGDFDSDGQVEIAAGDSDGDLFIYENTDDDTYSHTWTSNVPGGRIDCLTTGDFDGDGVDEFVTCAKATEPPDMAEKRWMFSIFDCFAHDSYRVGWSVEVVGMRCGCGVSAGDVDGDGQDEMVLLSAPNLYVLDPGTGTDHNFYAWWHPASDTYRPIIDDTDDDGIYNILFNDADVLASFQLNRRSRVPIQRPWGLSATPLSENEVQIYWNGSLDASSYRIYRGIGEDSLQLFTTVDPGLVRFPGESSPYQIGLNSSTGCFTFRDKGLKKDVTYWYSISAVNSAGQESELSDKASVTPNSPPKILSAEYVPPFTLKLTFNEPMGPSAQNKDHYTITSSDGFKISPSSAVLTLHETQVFLTLGDLPQGVYTITAYEIRDATGVPISDNNSAKFYVLAQDVPHWSDLKHVIVYPNPVMPNSRHPGHVTFDHLPPDAVIQIYDINGQLVKTLRDGADVPSHYGKVLWHLDNNRDIAVASGMYIYVMERAGDRKVGKLAVIR